MARPYRRTGQPTLHDVSARAGVNIATASRALSEDRSHLVQPETAQRVRDAARDLGYRANPIARGLRKQRTYTIGVLVPDLMNPIYPPLVRGVEDAIASAGYRPLVGNTDNDPARERVVFEALRTRRVDGFVVACARQQHDLIHEAVAQGVRMVLVLRGLDNSKVTSILLHDRAGVSQAVGHLVGLGHRRIAHVAGPQTISTAVERRLGFIQAMREARLVHAPVSTAAQRFGIAEGRDACRDLLSAGERPTAIFAGDDLIALGCIDALAERGLRCPADVSVVGYDDIPFAGRFDPPLTTIRVPNYELGARGGRLLLDEVDQDGLEAPRVELLSTELVVRGSTAAPTG